MRTRRGKKKSRITYLSGKGADDWREVVAAERASLFATPKRCAEIERRQPEALERGRPLFYVPDASARRSRRHHVEEEIAPSPQNGRAIWRKTFEFEGDEAALAEADEESLVVAQEEDLADDEKELAVAAD
jgi:hypothetical protein